MRYKFVATSLKRGTGNGSYAFGTYTPTSTAVYLDSNSVSFRADGTTTLIVDNVTGDQWSSSQTYTTTITRLDTASASSIQGQIDLT